MKNVLYLSTSLFSDQGVSSSPGRTLLDRLNAAARGWRYPRTVLGFLGMTDVEFVVADGLNLGAESRQQSLRNAHRQIGVLVAKLTARSMHRSAA